MTAAAAVILVTPFTGIASDHPGRRSVPPALFGGFPLWIAEWLVHRTGWTAVPGAVIAVVAMGFGAVPWRTPETAPGRIRAT